MTTRLSITEAFEKWAEDLTRYATVLVGADDAVDAVNQAFADVLASGRWPSVASPRGYLFAATLNASRAMRRSRGRRQAREWRTHQDRVVHLELLSDPEVVAAVNALSIGERSVIYLAYWEDMTPRATASFLEVSDGTVRRQLARARAKLRKALT
jgi:RNA polymerase sigma factor (sigma-70 family)